MPCLWYFMYESLLNTTLCLKMEISKNKNKDFKKGFSRTIFLNWCSFPDTKTSLLDQMVLERLLILPLCVFLIFFVSVFRWLDFFPFYLLSIWQGNHSLWYLNSHWSATQKRSAPNKFSLNTLWELEKLIFIPTADTVFPVLWPLPFQMSKSSISIMAVSSHFLSQSAK